MTTYRMLGAEEVSAILDCTVGTVEEMFRTKRLPGMKAGRSWRVTEAALFAALDSICAENCAKESEKASGFKGVPLAYAVEIPEGERVAANGPRRKPRAPLPNLAAIG